MRALYPRETRLHIGSRGNLSANKHRLPSNVETAELRDDTLARLFYVQITSG